MMKDDLVSIIVPVYNVAPYLVRCLTSILAQEYSNIEVLLVDDGSTDKSGMICDACAEEDSRICVVHKENGGLSDARNAGLKMAKGKYVSFIDSDDYVHPSFISCMKQAMDRTGCGIGKCDILEDTGHAEPTPLREVELCVYGAEEYLEKIDRINGGFSVCNKLFLRSLFDNIQFPKGKLHEDVAVIYRLAAQAGRIVSTEQTLYYYYVNGQSITKSRMNPRRLDDLVFRLDMYHFCRGKGWKRAARQAAEMLLRRILDAQNYNASEVDAYEEYSKRLSLVKKHFIRSALVHEKWSPRHKAAILYHLYNNRKNI